MIGQRSRVKQTNCHKEQKTYGDLYIYFFFYNICIYMYVFAVNLLHWLSKRCWLELDFFDKREVGLRKNGLFFMACLEKKRTWALAGQRAGGIPATALWGQGVFVFLCFFWLVDSEGVFWGLRTLGDFGVTVFGREKKHGLLQGLFLIWPSLLKQILSWFSLEAFCSLTSLASLFHCECLVSSTFC